MAGAGSSTKDPTRTVEKRCRTQACAAMVKTAPLFKLTCQELQLLVVVRRRRHNVQKPALRQPVHVRRQPATDGLVCTTDAK